MNSYRLFTKDFKEVYPWRTFGEVAFIYLPSQEAITGLCMTCERFCFSDFPKKGLYAWTGKDFIFMDKFIEIQENSLNHLKAFAEKYKVE